jgi:hypothetical protein
MIFVKDLKEIPILENVRETSCCRVIIDPFEVHLVFDNATEIIATDKIYQDGKEVVNFDIDHGYKDTRFISLIVDRKVTNIAIDEFNLQLFFLNTVIRITAGLPLFEGLQVRHPGTGAFVFKK